MSLLDAAPGPWAGRILSLCRIVAGLVFVSAGTMKLFGFPPSPMPGDEPLTTQLLVGAVLEVVGGAAIVLGLLTRPVALVLSGEMAVAYFQFHHPRSFFPTVNGGVAAMMYSFFFLYLAFAGAGPWSLDAVLARRRGADRRERS